MDGAEPGTRAPGDAGPAERTRRVDSTHEISRTPDAVRQAVGWADAGRALASARGRPDLVERLDAVRAGLADQMLPVAVVGEFKRGKSTLVNALLQTTVCPVDADVVTAVPTFVRYGDEPSATAYREPESQGEEPVPEPVPLAEVAALVSESEGPAGLRSVEVRLRHRLLRSGLCLVDTPGVGGLESAHGVITLGALEHAQGVLFVTDASQELTGPELDFLRRAVSRCPVAACVVTKTDLHAEWRRIVELDEGHLRDAGLDLPVIPVSSFLRMRSARRPELLEESGFPALAAFLARAVIEAAGGRAVRAAAEEVGFVTAQLAVAVEAEREALARPDDAGSVRKRLSAAEQESARLASPTATWQQTLADGVQDLVADVEHDLHRRLRLIGKEAEAVIEQGDPRETWPDVSAWLRKEVAAAVVASHDELVERTEALADDVAQQFDLQASRSLSASLPGFGARLDRIDLPDKPGSPGPSGRLGAYIMAGRLATVPPMLAYGVGGSLLGMVGLPFVAVLAPFAAAALAAGIGRKLIKDERQRQVAFRRQQTAVVVRRYLDDVTFVAGKDCRDGLRRTQRMLRDEFQGRAVALHASVVASARSVSRAATLPASERDRRAGELDMDSAELERLRARLAVVDADRVRSHA